MKDIRILYFLGLSILGIYPSFGICATDFEGITVDQNGSLIPYVEIVILKDNDIVVFKGYSNENGKFSTFQPPGDYVLIASTQSHRVKKKIAILNTKRKQVYEVSFVLNKWNLFFQKHPFLINNFLSILISILVALLTSMLLNSCQKRRDLKLFYRSLIKPILIECIEFKTFVDGTSKDNPKLLQKNDLNLKLTNEFQDRITRIFQIRASNQNVLNEYFSNSIPDKLIELTKTYSKIDRLNSYSSLSWVLESKKKQDLFSLIESIVSGLEEFKKN